MGFNVSKQCLSCQSECYGWALSSDLLTIDKIFNALGNERPEILIQLENCVLEGVIAITEGVPREEAMHLIYSQLKLLRKDLVDDGEALSWFNLSSNGIADSSHPPTSEFPSTPTACDISVDLPSRHKGNFQGQWCF